MTASVSDSPGDEIPGAQPVGADRAASGGAVSHPGDGQSVRAISDEKLAANRANAKRSTGPRSPQGKARSAGNAVRHGLNAVAALDEAETEEVEALALRLSSGCPAGMTACRAAAQAHIHLQHVLAVKSQTLEAAIARISAASGTRSRRPARDRDADEMLRIAPSLAHHDRRLRAYAKALAAPIVVTPQRTADEVLALAYVDCGPRLITLETYERKARSRRAKALRSLWE